MQINIKDIKTAPSLSLTTGMVPNNALNHGNAEELECAREADGAQDLMDAKDPHSQLKPQAFPILTERDRKEIFPLTLYLRR
jgi:hypothetical protein